MITRAMSMLCVVVAWAVVPLLKRKVLDYMTGPELGGPSPVRTFVALNSLGCTVVAAILAYPTGPRQFVDAIPGPGWTALVAGVLLSTVAGIMLVGLISSGNPGETIVYLNAGTNVLTYVAGALLYGKLTWEATAGVLLIAAGGVLMA